MRVALHTSKALSLTVNETDYQPLTHHEAFFLATLGGAQGQPAHIPVCRISTYKMFINEDVCIIINMYYTKHDVAQEWKSFNLNHLKLKDFHSWLTSKNDHEVEYVDVIISEVWQTRKAVEILAFIYEALYGTICTTWFHIHAHYLQSIDLITV